MLSICRRLNPTWLPYLLNDLLEFPFAKRLLVEGIDACLLADVNKVLILQKGGQKDNLGKHQLVGLALVLIAELVHC